MAGHKKHVRLSKEDFELAREAMMAGCTYDPDTGKVHRYRRVTAEGVVRSRPTPEQENPAITPILIVIVFLLLRWGFSNG